MPTINLGKVTVTDADILAKPEVYTTGESDRTFIAQDGEVKQLPVNRLPGGDGGATPVKVLDLTGMKVEDLEKIDFSVYNPGDVVLIVGEAGTVSTIREVSEDDTV